MSKTKKDLIYEYLNAPLNLKTDNESDKYIDAILSLSSTSSTLGGEVALLLSSLNAMQKHRLESLQKEFKNGLSDAEKPFGNTQIEPLQSDFLYYAPKDEKNKMIEAFLEDLENYHEIQDAKERAVSLRAFKKIVNEFRNKNVLLKNYITTQNQKKVWNQLILNDQNKMDTFELDDILLKMKLLVTKHSKKLKEIADYFRSIEKIENDFVKVTSTYIEKELYFNVLEKYKMDKAILKRPKTDELVKEVANFKEALEDKLERLPQYLNDEQKTIISDFLPMLYEYYEDQCSAFVQDKRYLPMAKDLQEFHDSIESLKVAEFLAKSDKLGYTMQHLYLLHWVAEELMKKFQKLNLTLGKSIKKRQAKHQKKHKDFIVRYENFMQGVLFRNNVAHNGIIWEPTGFENAIQRYKKGILLLGNDFSVDLKREQIPKRYEQHFSDKEKENIKHKQELLLQDNFSSKYFQATFAQAKDALKLYNTSLEKVTQEVSESSDFRPAFNTYFYLFKKYQEGLVFDHQDNAKLQRIKNIIEEN